MANLPSAASIQTRDITIDVLLERILNNFRTLKSAAIHEEGLKEDLEDLSAGLKEVGQEMAKEFQWFKDLLAKVRSEERKALFLSKLKTDRDLLVKTRIKFNQADGLIGETSNIVEEVYKITSSRSLLGRLKNPAAQRSMSQSLSKISVAQEKVFEARKGLKEILEELGRRGIDVKMMERNPETKKRMKAARSAARSAVKRLTSTEAEE